MKRKDAFRKVRTVCERLDEIDPDDFYLHPLALYLYGSLLTDRPDPNDVNLVLLYKYQPELEEHPERRYEQVVLAAMRGKDPFTRARVYLREGMKMVKLEPADHSLENWPNWPILVLGVRPRLVWKPGFDWEARLTEIEASTTPWEGKVSEEETKQNQERLDAMGWEEIKSRLARILEEIEV